MSFDSTPRHSAPPTPRPRRSFRRSGPAGDGSGVPGSAVLLLLLFLAPLALARTAGAGCSPGDPHVVLATTRGDVVVRLHPDAAPATVARLLELARTPLYSEALGLGDEASAPRAFDGLVFERVVPRREIRTGTLGPASSTVPSEIDAAALGLDDDRIADLGQAMDTLQFEVLEYWGRVRGTDRVGPVLAGWVDRYRTEADASFLIGLSRRQVLEAQGYVFRDGLRSRPVVRGSVSLVPHEPGFARWGFSIALTDFPNRRGRQAVVGTVVEGMDVVDEIGTAPMLQRFTGRKGDAHRPLDPVTVISVRPLDCPASPAPAGRAR